jgi:hypothetical protein
MTTNPGRSIAFRQMNSYTTAQLQASNKLCDQLRQDLRDVTDELVKANHENLTLCDLTESQRKTILLLREQLGAA